MREEVGQQFVVMIGQRIMALCRRDKITRNQCGALMDQLIERMLTIRARFAPNNRAGLVVVDHFAVAIDVFTVGFHIALLEIGGKTV